MVNCHLFNTRQWNLQNFVACVNISKRSIKISQGYIFKNSCIELCLKLFLCVSFSFIFAISFKRTEAVAQRCSVKKVFLKILQNSQEYTCARVSFLRRLQTCIEHLRCFWKQPFADVFQEAVLKILQYLQENACVGILRKF